MLKFFRKYNKFILAVFGTLLMVVFLIDVPLQRCTPGQGDDTVGQVNGRAITQGDQNDAANQLEVLRRLRPSGGLPLLAIAATSDPMTWLLMVEEAEMLSLFASQHEVDEVLGFLGINDSIVADVAQNMKVARKFVRKAVRNWAMVESYKSLVYGVTNLSVQHRVQRYQTALNYLGVIDLKYATGDPHMSTPVLKRIMHGLFSTVQISTVLVGYDSYLDKIEDPSDETIRKLFEQFKDRFRGQSDPYGFGYQIPNRVKIEYLTVAIDDLRDSIVVVEREALAYYKQNKHEFSLVAESAPTDTKSDQAATTQPTSNGLAAISQHEVAPYSQVRDQVHDRLRELNAAKQSDQIMAFARQSLLDQVKTFARDGYCRALPSDFQPMHLALVQDQIKKQFGVDVTIVAAADRWHSPDELQQLQGISASKVGLPPRAGRSQQFVPFAEYVLSVRELDPAPNHPALKLGLQTRLPSNTLKSDKSRFLFRVVAVEQAHTPPYEAVRAQVMRDARGLAAYKLLCADQTAWVDQAQELTLEGLAEKLNRPVNQTPPFPRRQPSLFELQVPYLPSVGQDAAFVDRVFELAPSQPIVPDVQSATAAPGPATAALPVVAISVTQGLKLFLVRFDQYSPVSHGTYQRITQEPQLTLLVSPYLATASDDNPISVDALKARLHFTKTR